MSGLPPGERYNHFVKRVADWEWVWALEQPDGGLVQSTSDDGVAHLALWPHPRYAEACAEGDWAGTVPAGFEVHDWVVELLPKLAADGIMLAVFPTPEHQGFIVPPGNPKSLTTLADLTRDGITFVNRQRGSGTLPSRLVQP